MPQINDARDASLRGERSAEQRFERLHRLGVAINAVQFCCYWSSLPGSSGPDDDHRPGLFAAPPGVYRPSLLEGRWSYSL